MDKSVRDALTEARSCIQDGVRLWERARTFLGREETGLAEGRGLSLLPVLDAVLAADPDGAEIERLRGEVERLRAGTTLEERERRASWCALCGREKPSGTPCGVCVAWLTAEAEARAPSQSSPVAVASEPTDEELAAWLGLYLDDNIGHYRHPPGPAVGECPSAPWVWLLANGRSERWTGGGPRGDLGYWLGHQTPRAALLALAGAIWGTPEHPWTVAAEGRTGPCDNCRGTGTVRGLDYDGWLRCPSCRGIGASTTRRECMTLALEVPRHGS